MKKSDFLNLVEEFLRSSGLSPTTFGKKAKEDPKFVFNLRDGTESREATQQKVIDFMRSYAAAHEIDFDVEGRSNA